MTTMHAYSYASRHERQLSVTPDIPSPTLTNPDMILPYPAISSSPTPAVSSPLLHSRDYHVSTESPTSMNTSTDARPEVGIATAIKMPLRIKPNPPTRVNLAFSNYEHGAPLSDIGEEESTPRSKTSRRSRSPSPTAHISSKTTAPVVQQTEALSDHSPSSRGSDLGDWEQFDSSRMLNDRLAADVAVATDDETDAEVAESKKRGLLSSSADDEMNKLNERAERILENARKRLTHMEDNLSKARQSILLTSRSSPNIGDLHSPGGLYRSISLVGAGQRKSKPTPMTRASSVTHSRGGSDSTGTTGLKRLSIIPEVRSASALEYTRGLESPRLALSSPTGQTLATSPASSHSFNSPQRVLEEEEPSPSTNRTSPENAMPRGLGIDTTPTTIKEKAPISSKSSPLVGFRPSSSASTRSTKELRDQMSDLKLRIADLKAKAEADSAKRRNLQAFRSASPFTSAQDTEPWYTSSPEYKQEGTPISPNAGPGFSPLLERRRRFENHKFPSTPNMRSYLEIEVPSTGQTIRSTEARTDMNTPNLHNRKQDLTPPAVDKDDSHTHESHYEEAKEELEAEDDQVAASEEEQIYLNEVLEESLQDVDSEIPDVPDHFLPGEAEAERHEDRLDAFDYENMFLHSALGNYTGAGMRDTIISESDGSSVTTRRPGQQTPTVVDHREDEFVNSVDSEEGSSNIDEQLDEEEDISDSKEDEELEDTELPIQYPATENEENRASTDHWPPPQPWMRMSRNNSMDSISTAATYATATEGSTDEGEGAPHEILNWANLNGTAFPKPPATSPKKDNYLWNKNGGTPTTTRTLPYQSPSGLRSPLTSPRSNITTTTIVQKVLSPVSPNFTNNSSPMYMSSPTKNFRNNNRQFNSSPPNYDKELPQKPQSEFRYQDKDEKDEEDDEDDELNSIDPSLSESDHPANTEILMESLIKLADPEFQVPLTPGQQNNTTNVFNDMDKNLVLALLRAVGEVCNQILKNENNSDMKGVKILRKRLDNARKGLLGG